MGTAQVLTTLTALGIEKSALKLVPRATRTGPQLITVLLLSALLLTGAAVVWLGCAALFARSGDAVVLGLLAGLYAALLGLNTVLVGLCRALDRNRADVLNFAALSLVIAVGAGEWLCSAGGPCPSPGGSSAARRSSTWRICPPCTGPPAGRCAAGSSGPW